ncbi:hypothetical protein GCM10025879_04270 [Leuconostoc litchii]|nr:hypothetical protein GCM10025879_04270 [Leuconostoc litchii]
MGALTNKYVHITNPISISKTVQTKKSKCKSFSRKAKYINNKSTKNIIMKNAGI